MATMRPVENGRRCNTLELSLAQAPLPARAGFWANDVQSNRTWTALYLTRARATKRPALLPPYTTGSVRIRSNLDMKLGRVIGGWQWQAADRRCASRCGHSSRGASGLGVAFVGALCRRIDSQGVRPRSFELEDQQSGKSAGSKPRARPPALGANRAA